MYIIRLKNVYLWLLIIAGLLSGCFPKSTPPGANSVGGGVDGSTYSYHYWAEGLAILIWHDVSSGGAGCTGSGSTEDPVYRLECDVEALDGRRFNWEIHTSDGVTADMWIEGQRYDLSQGTMFLVSSLDGEVEVVQLHRDFSILQPDNDTISALAISDSDIANFVERIKTQ
jgi:hypothetical protein